MDIKKCCKCLIEKSLVSFTRNKGGKFGVHSVCKPCRAIYMKENSEKINAWRRENYKKNNPPKQKVLYDKSAMLAREKQTAKEWRERNKEKLRLYNKNYRELNRDKIKERMKKYTKENRDKINIKNNLWKENNKDRIKIYQEKIDYKAVYKRQKEKRKNNKSLYLAYLIRIRLNSSLKSLATGKNNKTMDYVGCSKEELIKYLESKFTEGMSWENQGYYGWHIDHIKPLSSFDLAKEEEIYKAMNYTNLQPLWRFDNQSKGAKI